MGSRLGPRPKEISPWQGDSPPQKVSPSPMNSSHVQSGRFLVVELRSAGALTSPALSHSCVWNSMLQQCKLAPYAQSSACLPADAMEILWANIT